MSFDASALTDFVKENAAQIIVRSLMGMNTAKYVTVQPGVKSAMALTQLDPDGTLQDGSCGWTPTGTTTLTQRVITVCDIMNQENLCTKDLEAKFLQLEVTAGTIAGSEDMPIEEMYISQKIKVLNKKIDVLLWQGDTGSGDADLNKCDGWLKILTADVPAGQQKVRTASVKDDIDTLLETIPEDTYGADDLTIYLSLTLYRSLVKELRDDNNFHFTGQENMDFVLDYPGFNVQVVGVVGLQGSNSIVLSAKSNMYLGTDLQSDFEEVDFFYDKSDRVHKFHANWRQGVQVGFVEEVAIAQ